MNAVKSHREEILPGYDSKLFLFAAAAFLVLAGASSAEIIVNLVSPANGYVANNSTTIDLTFNYTSNDSINLSCVLYLNGSQNSVNNISNNTNWSFTVGPLTTSGVYPWYINCTNLTSGEFNVSATRSIVSDGTIPNVTTSFLTGPDSFFSLAADSGLVAFNLTVNDSVTNVTRVEAQLVSPGPTVVMALNMTNYTSLAVPSSWNGTFNVTSLLTNTSIINSTSPVAGYSILFYAYDQANNTVQGTPPSISQVLLHDLGSFQGPPPGQASACFREGTGTTNLSSITNFGNTTFTMIPQINGSCIPTPPGITLWTGFKTVANFTFFNVNMSTQSQAQAVMSAMGNLITVNMSPPRSFNPSRIFVNSTNLTSLNVSANVTLYDLPFSTQPTIVHDNGSSVATITWTQGAYNSTYGFFIGNLTIAVGSFSGYNVSDSSNPTVTISNPAASLNTTTTTTFVNVTINGTGTEVSNLIINITNSSGSVRNSTQFNLTQNGTVDVNTANCTNLSASYELLNCQYTAQALPEGAYTLTVVAYDYGTPPAGNSNTTTRTYTIDTSAPSITLNSPANNSISTNGTATAFNFTATDAYTPPFNCSLYLGTGTPSLNTTNSSVSNNTATVLTANLSNGVWFWFVGCKDSLNNPANSSTASLLIDTANSSILLNTTTNVTANQSVVVSNSSPPANITMASGVTNVTLNVSSVYNSTTFNATITNAITVNATTSLGNIVIQIPANVTITGASDWSGAFNLPYVTTASATPSADSGYNTISTFGTVEVGLPSTGLNFSSAVRILIPGAAGKYAAYVRGSTVTKITSTCSADTQAVGDALSAGTECKIDSGSDMVIWTKHFTQFSAYSQSYVAPTVSPGGNNAGGSIVGGGSVSGTSQNTNEVPVTTDDGRSCAVSLKREISSTNALSVITNTLTNNGGEGCSFADFVFSDTFPSNFPAGMNEVKFSPAYSSQEGLAVAFSFPSFAPSESKTVTYSVSKWVPPSRLNNFTLAAFSAAKKAAAPPTPKPPVQPPAAVCGNGKLEAGEECDSGISCGTGKRCSLTTCKCVAVQPAPTPALPTPAAPAPTAPQQGGLEWLGFAALGVGVLVVLAAIYFLAGKRKRGL